MGTTPITEVIYPLEAHFQVCMSKCNCIIHSCFASKYYCSKLSCKPRLLNMIITTNMATFLCKRMHWHGMITTAFETIHEYWASCKPTNNYGSNRHDEIKRVLIKETHQCIHLAHTRWGPPSYTLVFAPHENVFVISHKNHTVQQVMNASTSAQPTWQQACSPSAFCPHLGARWVTDGSRNINQIKVIWWDTSFIGLIFM